MSDSLVQFVKDFEFGTVTKVVNGLPISFQKLTDQEIEAHYRYLARVEADDSY